LRSSLDQPTASVPYISLLIFLPSFSVPFQLQELIRLPRAESLGLYPTRAYGI
jgi:hypothetical protein